MFFDAVNISAVFVMSLGAAYFFLAAGLGVHRLRRSGVALGFQATISFGRPFAPLPGTDPVEAKDWNIYFLVPCLNEAAVIGDTVKALLDPKRRSRIVIVDDGSDDGTAELAKSAGRSQVKVVTRQLPDARRGKGAALNAGFDHIVKDVARRRLDQDTVIVCVMDADGRLSDGAVHEVLHLFEDEEVGAVQLAVRIRNRDDSFLLRFQDHQFWTLSSLTQFGRVATGTVSLGGNGQFARLSALVGISGHPWSSSLTEDLDLSISLATLGWTLTSTPRAVVNQQGVDRLRALLRQRVRWYQGHMMAARRLPDVIGSRSMSHRSSLEMVLYLLVPWTLDLPWSILYHLICVEVILRLISGPLIAGAAATQVLGTFLIYLLGFWPALVTAWLAKKRDPGMSWPQAMKLGHAFVVTNYLSYVCAWTALFRIIRHRHVWDKTIRLPESVPAEARELVLAG